jgi:outer membrane protein assembly factor BamB
MRHWRETIRAVFTVIFLLTTVVCQRTVTAQERPPRPFRESVTVAVDTEAAKVLQTVAQQIEAGAWRAALDPLWSLLETHASGLVPVDPGEEEAVGRYQIVSEVVTELISSLPAGALTAYRDRIDPLAERWWQQWLESGEVQWLHRLHERAFLSQRGDDAVLALAERAWQQGDLVAAGALWTRLLPAEHPWNLGGVSHPDPSISPADVAARLVLARGWQTSGAPLLAPFQALHPNDMGQLGGKRGLWIDLLQSALDSPGRSGAEFLQDCATVGATPSRNGVMAAPFDLGPERWSRPLGEQRLLEISRPLLFAPPPALCYLPAVVDDLVLVNDGRQIWGWRLYDGQPAFGPATKSAAFFPPIAAEELPFLSRPVVGSAAWTVTVSDDRLLARMGSAVTTRSLQEGREPENQLVCLDLTAAGELLWSVRGSELPIEQANAVPWSWEGTPVVVDGLAYAAVSRRRPQLEWAVVCLSVETGAVQWQQSVGIARPTRGDHEDRASQLLLTAADGQLVLSTDAGLIAAVSAVDGRLSWAVTYESQPVELSPALPQPRRWPSPSVAAEGAVYVAPADSRELWCLDAANGRVRWRRESPEPIDAVLGVVHGRVFFSGQSLYAFDADQGRLLWSFRSHEPEDAGYGRGVLAGRDIWWCSRLALRKIEQESGALLSEVPLRDAPEPRSGGHVVCAHDTLLITSANRITAYGPHARAWGEPETPWSARPVDSKAVFHWASRAWASAKGLPSSAEQAGNEQPIPSSIRSAGNRSEDGPLAVQHTAVAVSPNPPSKQAGRDVPESPTMAADETSAAQIDQATRALTAAAPDRFSRLWQQRRRDERPRPPPPSLWNGSTIAESSTGPSAEASADPDGQEYWRRAWRRSWPAGSRLVSVQSSSSLRSSSLRPSHSAQRMLLQGPMSGVIDPLSGQLSAAVPVSEPVLWAADVGDDLLLITSQRRVRWNPVDSRVIWQRRWAEQPTVSASRLVQQADQSARLLVRPAAASALLRSTGPANEDASAWRCSLTPGRLWVQGAGRELSIFDLHTGEPIVSLPMRAAVPLITPQEVLVPSNGQLPARRVLPTGTTWWTDWTTAWRGHPVAGPGDQWCAIDAERRPIGVDGQTGRPQWRFLGPLSWAHADPFVFFADDHWYVLVDGVTLCRVMLPSGRPQWMTPVAAAPLRSPQDQLLHHGDVVISASGQRLRAISLKDGRLRWQHPLPSDGEPLKLTTWGAACCFAVWQTDQSEAATSPSVGIQIRDIETGSLRQQLALPAAEGPLVVGSVDHQAWAAGRTWAAGWRTWSSLESRDVEPAR